MPGTLKLRFHVKHRWLVWPGPDDWIASDPSSALLGPCAACLTTSLLRGQYHDPALGLLPLGLAM